MIDLSVHLADPDPSCCVIAEVAQAHDGSLGRAHAYVDAVADAGADVVKFQTHIAAAESTPAEPWRVPFSPQDSSRYDYWKRMEFSEERWLGLRKHAEERDLAFSSSPFSLEAVELLERVGVGAWKIASGEVSDAPVVAAVLDTGRPVLLSTGMSPFSEVDAAVGAIRAAGVPFAVLQATSAYPCPPEDVGLDLIPRLRERYGAPAGLSDHSGTIYAGLAAAALGAAVVEVHVTFSRRDFGPDVAASVTIDELATLVEGVSFINRMRASRADKDAAAAALEATRAVFAKSVVASRDLPAGTVLDGSDLVARKAGGGLSPARLGDLVGRSLRHPLAANQALSEEDLEP